MADFNWYDSTMRRGKRYGYDIFKDEVETKAIHLSKSEIDLFDKIDSGDVNDVRKCLSDRRTRKKININCCDEGFTPLTYALAADNEKDLKRMIRLLLKWGAQINIQSCVGQTALHKACYFRSVDAINVLLKNGADPDIRESCNGYTPLHLACIETDVMIAKSLLLYNADVNCLDYNNETALMHASRSSCSYFMFGKNIITTLLENNASVNLQNVNGETALHIACKTDNCDNVELLLSRGNADVNCRDKNDETPLMHASRSKCYKHNVERIVSILLENNASINLQNVLGETALYIASHKFGSEEAIPILIRFGADPNIKANNSKTPLHVTCEYFPGRFNAQLLLEYNMTDVNCQDKNGDTPLHYRVKNCISDIGWLHGLAGIRIIHTKFVQMILNYNPDLRIVNNDRKTALDLIKELVNNEIRKCIEGHMHKKRCQMYTFYHDETWCHSLLDSLNNNIKLISPVKKRKR